MKILAIETTGKYGSATVIDEDGRLYSATSHEEMNHLKGMISLIDEAIGRSGAKKTELTHIAASVGPGSFTGIRIGVTTARTMAQMLGIPCIGVSTLAALAEGADTKDNEIVVPIINARRHQTYAGGWRSDGSNVIEERQYMIEELLQILSDRDLIKDGIVFTGDGIDAYQEIIDTTLPQGTYKYVSEDLRYQQSDSVARLASAMAEQGNTVSYDELMPEYMRLAEAEQKLKAGTLSDRIRKPV